MEHNQSPLFSLNIDPVTKAHLSETAKWAKFLAITGMVFLFLLMVFGFLTTTLLPRAFNSPEGDGVTITSAFSFALAAYTILIAVLWFFPLLFTLRFANKMKLALAGNDQQALNSSFQNLKICMRYLGILTIVVLAIYAVIIVMGIVSAGMLR